MTNNKQQLNIAYYYSSQVFSYLGTGGRFLARFLSNPIVATDGLRKPGLTTVDGRFGMELMLGGNGGNGPGRNEEFSAEHELAVNGIKYHHWYV